MARVGYQLIPPEYEDYFRKALSPGFRFELPRMMRTNRLISRKRKKALIAQSFLNTIAEAWRGLSFYEKDLWEAAANEKGWFGWKLFLQEQSIRIKKELSGLGTPSLKHQGRFGRLDVFSPADKIKIIQPHPNYYWISRIAPGRYPLTELKWVKESFSLPLTIGLNYRAELTPETGDPKASFYADVWHSYQGVDLHTHLSIELDLDCDWKSAEKTLDSVIGHIIHYDIFFSLEGVRGSLFFDNVRAIHSGYNWARDPYCSAIDEEFSRSFFQVLSYWIPIEVPSGASYYSDYFDF